MLWEEGRVGRVTARVPWACNEEVSGDSSRDSFCGAPAGSQIAVGQGVSEERGSGSRTDVSFRCWSRRDNSSGVGSGGRGMVCGIEFSECGP